MTLHSQFKAGKAEEEKEASQHGKNLESLQI